MADLSVLLRCQDAITDLITDLNLTNAPAVVSQKEANVLLVPHLPAIIVSIAGFNDSPSSKPFTFKTVMTGIRVAVAIMAHSSPLAQDADPYMTWREEIELACHVPTLAGVPELYRTSIEGGDRIEDQVKQKIGTPKLARFVSGFVVRCDVIRTRGS